MEKVRKALGATGILQMMIGASILDSASMLPGVMFIAGGMVMLYVAEVML